MSFDKETLNACHQAVLPFEHKNSETPAMHERSVAAAEYLAKALQTRDRTTTAAALRKAAARFRERLPVAGTERSPNNAAAAELEAMARECEASPNEYPLTNAVRSTAPGTTERRQAVDKVLSGASAPTCATCGDLRFIPWLGGASDATPQTFIRCGDCAGPRGGR